MDGTLSDLNLVSHPMASASRERSKKQRNAVRLVSFRGVCHSPGQYGRVLQIYVGRLVDQKCAVHTGVRDPRRRVRSFSPVCVYQSLL